MNAFIGEPEFDHKEVPIVGILLVNLGTPDAPTAKALRPYLRQFLSDPRVIEYPRLLWWLILNGPVLTFRPKKSAALYKKIWTKEGSPLRVIHEKIAQRLRQEISKTVGSPVVIETGMCYGAPSIPEGLEKLKKQGARKMLILPLYPHYSATSSGAVFDAVAKELMNWRWVPELRTIMQFHNEPGFIAALADSIRAVWDKDGEPDKLVMSFHGIPKRYFLDGDPYHCQCQQTGRLVAEHLGLSEDRYMITFQSLFGKEEWLTPATDATMEKLAKQGVEKLDVICPGFSIDCLETLEEIEGENKEIFLEHGGKQFRYIPALNDSDAFITVLGDIVRKNLGGWVAAPEAWDAQEAENEANASVCRYRAMNE